MDLVGIPESVSLLNSEEIISSLKSTQNGWGSFVPVCYSPSGAIPMSRRSTSTRSNASSIPQPFVVDTEGFIRLLYINCYNNTGSSRAEDPMSSALSIQDYVVFPNGEEHPVTFTQSGGYIGTAPTLGFLLSDPIRCSADFTRNQEIRIRSNKSVATAGSNMFPENWVACDPTSTGASMQWDATNVLADVSTVASRSTAITNDINSRLAFVPIILGKPKVSVKVIGVIGHSFFNRFGPVYGSSPAYTEWGKSGIIGRAQALKSACVVNVCAASESYATLAANGCVALKTIRLPLLMGCDRILLAPPVNDVLSSRTSTQMMNDIASVRAFITAATGITDFWYSTVPPLGSTSDNGVLASNFTVGANESNRTAVNTAIRSLAGSKLIDIDADIITQGGTGGKYPDATVFTTKATTAANANLLTWTEAAPNGYGYYYHMAAKAKTGTAGNIGQARLVSGSRDNGSNVVRVDLNSGLSFATTIGDTFDIYKLWTTDGTHPGHLQIDRWAALMTVSGGLFG